LLEGESYFDNWEWQYNQYSPFGARLYYHVEPMTIHRVEAIEDTTVVEVSTPEAEDVVRVEDDYGRASGSP